MRVAAKFPKLLDPQPRPPMPLPRPPNQTEDVHATKTIANSYPHLFLTNDPPSPIEVASLRQGVEAMVPWITFLRTELHILEERLHLHRFALSPIRRIPPEILHEIFRLVDEKTLLNVSMVCRAWYSASASISAEVLTTLEIRPAGPEGGIPCHRIRSWLAKPVKGTKTLKLGLYCHLDNCLKGTAPCMWTSPQFTGLIAQIPASATLALGFRFASAHCYLQLMGSICATPLWHSLSSLGLDFTGNWPGRGTKYRAALGSLPNSLKRLSLTVRSFSARPPPTIEIPETPFNTLKALSIDCEWYSPLLQDLLRRCVELEELSVVGARIPDWTGVAEVALPKLHTLILSWPYQYFHIYPLLRLPSLSRLTIEHHYYTSGPQDVLNSLGLLSPTPASRLRFLALHRTQALSGPLWLVAPSPAPHCLGRPSLKGDEFLPDLRTLEVRGINEWFDLENFLLFLESYQNARFGSPRVRSSKEHRVSLYSRVNVFLHYVRPRDRKKFDTALKDCSAILRVLNGDSGVAVHVSIQTGVVPRIET
ncbi:hypothetical protein FA13DRAFT_1802128 [Coprinellus micaceus]|uniref:F-box domain-containing protein n=1 Tax=Coprinellus micaceus TaxID=71717 RepID=A0A4Y7SD94_COPMI|nr:hypothetical protein FA13DRAFT_1802128 [Coprinellus micaceus]